MCLYVVHMHHVTKRWQRGLKRLCVHSVHVHSLLVLVVASDITNYLLFFPAVLHFRPAAVCSTVDDEILNKEKK